MKPIFEWNEKKARKNFRDHRVTFEEADSGFDDFLAITIPDFDHSIGEERFIDIGQSDRNRILIVVYTERRNVIRLISARLATRAERKQYEEENFPQKDRQ